MSGLNGYLRIKEAAEYLGVSQNTVRNWGKAGKIPEYRHPMNNYRLYRDSDLKKVHELISKSVSHQETS